MSGTLDVGVVGLGMWGQNHPVVYDDYHRANLKVVCDLDEARAKSVAETFGCDYTTDVTELVSSDITTFSVATPDHAHFAPVKALLEAGKNVLVEKPLTTDIAEAKELAAIAATSCGKAMVDYHLRWDPQWSMIKEAVESGRVGKPLMAYIRLSDVIEVAQSWLSWAGRSGPHWFLYPHILDLMAWIFDSRPVRVYATGHKGLLAAEGVDTWDCMQAMVTFENGANATLETSWVVPNSNPSVTDCHMTMYGSEARIEYDQDFSGISFATKEGYSYPWVPLGRKNRWGQLEHFMYAPMKYLVDCVLDDVTPECTFEEGLLNTATIHAAVQSLETGAPVEVADVLS